MSKFPSHPCLRGDKGIVWHINMGKVVCTLFNSGKFSKQIATLLPIVVKRFFWLKNWWQGLSFLFDKPRVLIHWKMWAVLVWQNLDTETMQYRWRQQPHMTRRPRSSLSTHQMHWHRNIGSPMVLAMPIMSLSSLSFILMASIKVGKCQG